MVFWLVLFDAGAGWLLVLWLLMRPLWVSECLLAGACHWCLATTWPILVAAGAAEYWSFGSWWALGVCLTMADRCGSGC